MEEALKRADADIQFQFFLARLFGRFIRKANTSHEVEGYAWRDHLYIVRSSPLPASQPNPSQDSQHRSSPDF